MPPAARGDLVKASRAFSAVLLVDGAFHHDLAVSPKEAYEAAQTTLVLGAASIGAIRGAECAAYGLKPVGIIARWYACGAIDGDDEVAVSVDPRTQRALSVALVNVRYLARRAVRAALLSRSQAVEIVRRAREIYYADRTWEDVIECADRQKRAGLRRLCEGGACELKQFDAAAALHSLLRRLS